MRTRPAGGERSASVEREVRAWVGWVEQIRGRLGRMVGDEEHAGAGCRATKLFKSARRDQGEIRMDSTLKRTLTDLRGVGGLGSLLSARHLRRCGINQVMTD